MNEDRVDRNAQLGFKPQKEIVYNKLLPYSDKLDEESAALFYDIKTNLIKSLLAREFSPGFALWTSRLHRYMRIYGLKFSKEDHICLVRIFYDLLKIPSLDPTRVNKFACTLNFLLKKKELLSRTELELQWRPLYDLFKRITKKNRLAIATYRYFSTLECNLQRLIRLARVYFPVTATQEILDELRPRLCPHKDLLPEIHLLETFLPVVMDRDDVAQGYQLWFEEFMNLWEVCHNMSSWEASFVSLMASLAVNNIGDINWDPYVPTMFARFQRTLQFPVNYKQKQSSRNFKISIGSMTLWIVSCLGGPSDLVFRHLESLMHATASYHISANVGRWSGKIREFLRRFSLHFINRIHNERFRRDSWENKTLDEYKLTDCDIDRFVNLLKPCLDYSIFGRHQQELIFTFNYLACLRPKIIIPLVLEKLYASMECLTEPHKLTSAIFCLTACARYMVQGQSVGYPEGPTHVIPLLMDLLPGIDPNDRRKCYMTFNFIVQFVNMIPIVNSSDACKYYELTEEEQIVCEATAGFEDFVLQFFDRLCNWISSNSLESTRLEQNESDRLKTKCESVAESALVSVISTVLSQSSPSIFSVALKKVFNYVTSSIFEIKVSGKMIAILCQVFSKVNPKESTKLFIPYFCGVVERLLLEVDLEKDENLSEELLYNLLILSEVVDCNQEILPYIERITGILDKILYMTSMQGYTLGTQMLNMILLTLTCIIPLEYRSMPISYDGPLSECLTVRHWGDSGDLSKLNIKWFTPGEKEIECAKMLVERYMLPQILRLDAYANGELDLTRHELRRLFKVIVACLACQQVLPLWRESAISFENSVSDAWEFELIVGNSQHVITMPDGSNIRKTLADVMHRVQRKILQVDEGDTKSFFAIICVYDVLLFNKFRGRDFESHWKNFHAVKGLLEDKLRKNKRHLRHILVDRVMLHHEFRNESRTYNFTATHKQIMLDMFELSTCRYSEVRIAAQVKLNACIPAYSYSYLILKEKIQEVLMMDSTEHHDKFKGCLYVMLGPKMPIITRHNWDFIKDVWPLLVKSKPSEKPSIVRLIDSLIEIVHKFLPTTSIDIEIDDKYLKGVYDLAASKPVVSTEGFDALIEDGRTKLQQLCVQKREAYNELMSSLLQIATGENLHWRYYKMAVCFMRDLVHPDVKYSPEVVRFFLKSLINDSIRIRKIGIKVMLTIIAQNKVRYPKITIDPYALANTTRTSEIKPGPREDNKWLMYDSNTFPKSAQEWNTSRYIHDDFTGYYCWPATLKVFDYTQNQSLNVDDMLPQQKEIHDFFMDKANIELLIKYHTIEEKKGNDKFNMFRFFLFKNLFKMFQSEPLQVFLPYVTRFVDDKQEQYQRCASEILAGVISGCKHWDYEQTVAMWTEVIPLLRKAFSNLSEETVFDWATSIGMGIDNRDPNRYNWLLEFLMDDPLSESTSFLGCARLYILFCAVNQNIWRNPELYSRVLTYFNTHLSAPFQIIRDKISCSLSNIFANDMLLLRSNEPSGPRVKDFIEYVEPHLAELYDLTVKKDIHLEQVHGDASRALMKTEVKENSVRLFKTVAKYVTSSMIRVLYTIAPEQFQLLPLACVLQSNEVDDELQSICTNLIAVFASTVIPKRYLNDAMRVVRQVATCRMWSARAVTAEFIPVFVFHNMANIIHTRIVDEVISTVRILLEDIQPEVRIKASQAMSGFLHVNFIPEPMTLLEEFRTKAKTRIMKRSVDDKISYANLHIRHAGVLGLCAFINSKPYDVPDYLPAIFADLGSHLNDPQPIPAAIRKTLGDFKRTHHANWEHHKQSFTEDELSVLTDLTVPPSYYA